MRYHVTISATVETFRAAVVIAEAAESAAGTNTTATIEIAPVPRTLFTAPADRREGPDAPVTR